MHDKEKFIENSIKKLEKRNLTQEQQKELDAFKVVFNFFKKTKTQGMALTGEEEWDMVPGELFTPDDGAMIGRIGLGT
jgi:hypothetical protein